jgi:hypothetical protein
MKHDEACVVLCRKIHKTSEIEMFKSMIDQEYRVHWLLDNLPVAVRNDELGYVSRGYPVGFVSNSPKSGRPEHYLYNHVRIIVRYSEEPEEFPGSRIVGFEVVPFSIKVKYYFVYFLVFMHQYSFLDYSMNMNQAKKVLIKMLQYFIPAINSVQPSLILTNSNP